MKHMAALSADELNAFLALPLTARLGSVTPDGYPFVTPVDYLWDGTRMYFYVRARAEYLANIRSNPRVGVSITAENGWSPRVLLLGQAALVCSSEDPQAWRDWNALWLPRMVEYCGGDEEKARGMFRHTDEELRMPMVGLKTAVERIISFQGDDYSPKYYR